MEVKIQVKLTQKEMFDFLLKHTYCSLSGFLSILLSVLSLGLFGFTFTQENVSVTYRAALLCIAALFLIVQPMMLYSKAKKQVKANESINGTLNYTVSPKGIVVSQGDEQVTTSWDEITKITSTGLSVIAYLNRMHAYVIPKKSIGEHMDEFKKIIADNCHGCNVKIK